MLLAKPAKRCFVLLALFALSLVLVRPVCDAYRTTGAAAGPVQVVTAQHSADESTYHDDSDPCCDSIETAALVAPSGVATVATKPSTVLFAAAPWNADIFFSLPQRRFTLPPDRPPILAMYYARTARILI